MLKKYSVKSFSLITIMTFICSLVSPYAVWADDEPWWLNSQVIEGQTTTQIYSDTQKDQPINNACFVGDPVYLHSGELYYECVDLTIPGRGMNVVIKHLYQSGSTYNGHYGYGWTMNYHHRLKPLTNGNAVIYSGLGRTDEYINIGGGDYTSPNGFFETLVQNGNGTWTLTKAHGERWDFDIDGNLTSIKDRNNNSIQFKYEDASGGLTGPPVLFPINGFSPYSRDPGQSVIVGYDYRLKQIIDTNGRIIDFNYFASPDGRLQSIVDNIPTGGTRTVTYTYDLNTYDLLTITKPATTQYPSGVTKTFTYSNHYLGTITDAKGQTFVTNHYDANGRVYQQDLGPGSYLFNYSVANQTTVTDRKGFVTKYIFDAEGHMVQKEQFTAGLHSGEPASYITTMTYNIDGLQTSVKYSRGNGVVFKYDSAMSGGTLDARARGNLLEIIRVEDMSAVTNPVTYTAQPNDLQTVITYETNYNFPKTITDPKGYITAYTYDYELPPSDPRYGTAGNLVQIDAPTVTAGTPITTFDYNANGQLIMVEDPNNNVVEYDYFPATGYFKEIRQDPSGINAVTQFTYDQFGNLDVVTDASGVGHETDYDYDALGWLNTVTNALSYVTNYFYDANGNVERVERQASDPVGTWQVTQFTYDTLNNLKTITDPLSRVTILNYDLSENLASSIDAETNTTTYVYDERDLLFTVTDANTPAGVTTYDYDNNGNLAKITDANLNLTTYTYDLYDRLDTMTYADSSVVDYDFDKNSNLDFVTLPGTHGTIDYDYDALNRLTAKLYALSPTLNSNYNYDLGSRLIDADNAAAQNHFTYDNLNRVQTNTQTLGSTPYALSYQYDNTGNRTKVIYPSGKTVDYTYDVNDRMDLVKVNTATLVDYDYDPLDRRSQKSYLSATLPLTTYSFDMANQLGSITNTLVNATAISQYNYPIYDNVGNRKQMTTTGTPGAQLIDYGYNNIYELTGVSGSQTHSYDYDKVANRELADGVVYVPNSLNQYNSVGGVPFNYDNNGNLTYDGVNTYTFDEENRLTTATNTSNAASYTYDAFNRRVSKIANSTTTYFINDGDREVEERDASGSLLADYVFGDLIDEVLTMTRSSNDFYYFYDGIGSVTEITDSTGAVVENYIYDSYGTPSILISTIENPFRFTGRRFDEETGLYFQRARMLHPGIGGFLQRDPIGYWDGMNLYAYVQNNPIAYTDPSGLGKIFTAIKIAGKGIKVGKAISKDVAKKIFKKEGGDILVSKKVAKQFAKSKGKKTSSGKKFVEELHGSGQKHIHPATRLTEVGKKSGHAFLHSFTAVAILGDNAFAQTIDFFNPISDLVDTIEFFEDPGAKLNEIIGEDEIGEEQCPN